MRTFLRILLSGLVLVAGGLGVPGAGAAEPAPAAALLPDQPEGAVLWWALSSASKIRPDTEAPEAQGRALVVRAARNETEAAQIVLRPTRALTGLGVEVEALHGPDGASLPVESIEILDVAYVDVKVPTEEGGAIGRWPDPLLPLRGPVDLPGGETHAFWVRVSVPRDQEAGLYRGRITLRADGVGADDFRAEVPVEVTVHDFTLPDRMTLTTAFGFSPETVFRYQGIETDADKRLVLERVFEDFSAHHVSPYDPAPLDPIRVTWPDVRPPRTAWDDWSNLRIVENEVHEGKGALLVYDGRNDENVTVTYEPLIAIPEGGLRIRGWYRTAIPGQRFLVSLNHHDAKRGWMSGHNLDVLLRGNGRWQFLDAVLREFPAGACFVRLHLRAAPWTEGGEALGLVWFDDLSVQDAATGEALLQGGDFERTPRTDLVVPPASLEVKLDFTAWDRAMTRAIDVYHFNAFRLAFPGLGGGTFHGIRQPTLCGFTEDDPEYAVLLASYGRQLQAHLREKGWLDEAFIYWFDEPSPDQYAFVKAGFEKLQRVCPDIPRMLTEQPEPALVGGPNVWCPISHRYDPASALPRREAGETFWWYVCTGPKAPYTGLFLDHPAPEMRIWPWQTWARGIEGLLVWQTNYWTSRAAYPDPRRPQDPYRDPMSWTSGYSTPAGVRRPWGNGDGRFLYPPVAAADGRPGAPVLEGPVDSIRWEHLRDGIEDVEVLVLLSRRLQAKGDLLDAATRTRFTRLLEVPGAISRSLTDFASDGAAIEAHREALARALEALR